MLDAELLSRIQFGFTVGFHILFPTLNIGLSIFICALEAMWLKTGNQYYYRALRFWTKLFALTFGMGVVSGVVLAYELGTNFGHFTDAVGNLLGTLFSYEVMSAFFLEAGFLGIMLFGWNRVSQKMHFFATLMVSIGTIISAFWIMSANSWMQTPAGFELVNGKYLVTSWFDAIFNPSFMLRFIHMMMASFVTSSFVIAGISAWYLLKNRHFTIPKKSFSIAIGSAFILIILQFVVGDMTGVKIFEHQPMKTAAIEGNWQTQNGAPLILFAIPDEENAKNNYEISIPYGASLINTHELNGKLPGLNEIAKSDWPLVSTVFYSFRIMLGIAILMLLLASWGLYLRFRKKLFDNRLFLRCCVAAAPLGFIATIAGWMVAESGRQPWVVYGLMRTSEGASNLPAQHVALSLLLFVLIYSLVFVFYLHYFFKSIRIGPKVESAEEAEIPPTIIHTSAEVATEEK